MDAGELNCLVALQSAIETPNQMGEPVKTWMTYAMVWAAIDESLSGDEALRARVVEAETTVKIKIRYLERVRRTHRAVFGTRIFEINDIQNPKQQNREMWLLCKELAT